LPDQRNNLVLDQVRTPLVVKARRQASHQINRSIARSHKQRARVRCHQSGIERSFHSPAFYGSKIKPFHATLCQHRGCHRICVKSLRHNNFR